MKKISLKLKKKSKRNKILNKNKFTKKGQKPDASLLKCVQILFFTNKNVKKKNKKKTVHN